MYTLKAELEFLSALLLQGDLVALNEDVNYVMVTLLFNHRSF